MVLEPLPRRFVEDFYLQRKMFVEKISRGVFDPADLLRLAPLMSPMIATHGPAGLNVAPFMVSFVPRREFLGGINSRLKRFVEEGGSMEEAGRLLLETVYRDEILDPHLLVTHLMSRGHTWINVEATGRAVIGILVPPDKGAYEVRARAWIEEEGLFYEYANLVHDVVHVAPRGEREHPWCPALVFEIEEIYDNSYQALGRLIYRRDETASDK